MSAVPTQAAVVYQERFDTLILRVRDVANARSTGPSQRQHLLEICDEMARLRRDLSELGDRPLSAVPEPIKRTMNGSTSSGMQRIGRNTFRPPDGKRYCANHNEGEGALLPVEDFQVKDAKSGKRASWCRACAKQYQRDRYVRLGFKVVTIEVAEGDACIGHACPKCGGKFAVGERVQGENIAHESCPK